GGWLLVSLFGARGFVFGVCATMARPGNRNKNTPNNHPPSTLHVRLLPVSSEFTFALSLTKGPPSSGHKYLGLVIQAGLHNPAARHDPYKRKSRQDKARSVDRCPEPPAAASPQPIAGVQHRYGPEECNHKKQLHEAEPRIQPLA